MGPDSLKKICAKFIRRNMSAVLKMPRDLMHLLEKKPIKLSYEIIVSNRQPAWNDYLYDINVILFTELTGAIIATCENLRDRIADFIARGTPFYFSNVVHFGKNVNEITTISIGQCRGTLTESSAYILRKLIEIRDAIKFINKANCKYSNVARAAYFNNSVANASTADLIGSKKLWSEFCQNQYKFFTNRIKCEA